MKICSSCRHEKELSEFRKNRSSADGHAGRCRDCASSAYKVQYKTKYGAKARERHKIRWNDNRQKLLEFKKNGCARCDETHIACLDFHHSDSDTKEFVIASALNRPWKDIEAEISKCIILCANCHRKEHHP